MTRETLSFLTILGMAVAAYATRVGGFWFMNRFPPSPRVQACLNHLPGAVLVSLIAPTAFTSGIPESVAMLATVLVAVRTKQVLLAMVVGVVLVWLLRMFL